MTKQEAIEILRDTPIDIRSTREDDIHTLYATAQGMAIEALSCSEKPNESEPKTAENGSLDSEMPEIETDRTTGGMIYRQDAIDVAKQHWYKPDIAKALEELPSEQPERKNGEWIHKPDIYLDEQTWECSECGEPWIFIEGTPSENNANFCPNCGARMDGEA